MTDNKPPEQRKIDTKGGDYSEQIEGDCIQGDKGDTINQSGSSGVGVNKGNIHAQNIEGDYYKIIYIYNYYHENATDLTTDSDDTPISNNIPCPYRGLFHFSPNNAKFFFGREVFIEKLFKASQTHNFIPVLGASGSGKSSVVFAGLVPRLEQEGNWRFTHFRPSSGNDPFYALAEALVPLYKSDLDSTDEMIQASRLAKYLDEEELSLAQVFSNIHRKNPNKKVLLIADQFEELYTQYPEQKCRRFLDCLIAGSQSYSSHSSSSNVIVTTMRADFFQEAFCGTPLNIFENNIITLGKMSHDELAEVIIKPIETLNTNKNLNQEEEITFADGLVPRILKDVEDEAGDLLLLEFALTKLWQKRKGKQLTHQAYEEIGEVKGALSKHATEKYEALNPLEKKLAEQIFIQLVQPGKGTKDTRRLVTKADLGNAKWSLVNKLANRDHRLVITSRRSIDHQDTNSQGSNTRQNQNTGNLNKTETDVVEIAHEALIKNWKQLKIWVEDNSVFRIWQERLQASIEQWKEVDKDSGSLLQGKLLNTALERLQEREYDFSEQQKKYIQKSREARTKKIIKTTASLFSF